MEKSGFGISGLGSMHDPHLYRRPWRRFAMWFTDTEFPSNVARYGSSLHAETRIHILSILGRFTFWVVASPCGSVSSGWELGPDVCYKHLGPMGSIIVVKDRGSRIQGHFLEWCWDGGAVLLSRWMRDIFQKGHLPSAGHL